MKNMAIVPQLRLHRAFQSIHGIAPSAVKSDGVSVKSFPPITFTIAVKGVEEMNYRIETKGAFRIIGISAPLRKEVEKNFMVVPQMWQDADVSGTIQSRPLSFHSPYIIPCFVCSINFCSLL
jgi:hypothetical protein